MRENKLPELTALQRLIDEGSAYFHTDIVCQVPAGSQNYPVHVLTLGNPSPLVPAVGFFGGIHGLERIGTQVLLAFMQALLARLRWDQLLHRQLDKLRLVFMPLVNPAGMAQATRCNPEGIDLMRNAPLDAGDGAAFLVGGQRLSAHLPWFRGVQGAPMARESAALCAVVERELFGRPFSLALDCHSGFGMQDRIWFPHAYTSAPMAHLAEVCALEELFAESHPHHTYVFEPHSRQYRTHGDLWDHLYLRSQAGAGQIFLPLTLEMGSWMWVKKNPRQMFTRQGIFNPTARHRLHRVLRRHTSWLEFLGRAASSHAMWLPQGMARSAQRARGLVRWYGRAA